MKPTRVSPPRASSPPLVTALRMCGIGAAVVWWLCLKSYASRRFTLLNYGSTASVSPSLEPLAPLTWCAFLASLACLCGWIFVSEMLWKRYRSSVIRDCRQWTWSVAGLIAACIPWVIDLAMHWQTEQALTQPDGIWGPSIWQPMWFSLFTGLAAGRFICALDTGSATPGARPSLVQEYGRAGGSGLRGDARWSSLVYAVACLCGMWWFLQSQAAFDGFMLGFNDCGHFAQRIANTAAGRGWLLESPVLPAYWDHFNPGLVLLVPLWWLWPSMSLIFVLQAAALSGTAPLVMRLARLLGASPAAASVWALAWLTQPILGQMNLAHTYGWHPVSMALPLLMAALCCVVQRRWKWALLWTVVACSFEEGVLIIVATTAATLGLIELLPWGLRRRSDSTDPRLPRRSVEWSLEFASSGVRRVSAGLTAVTWIAVAAVTTLAFILIFRFSGLADFQTGRFHALGGSSAEILLSPVTKPQAFWGMLLRGRSVIFLAGLLIPCFLPALARGWPLLLPVALPLCVLLVWQHLPAQSLAFHYASTLLPILWLAALAGVLPARLTSAEQGLQIDPPESRHPVAAPQRLAWQTGCGALASSLVASFTFGQLPWSAPTTDDVSAVTYYDPSRQWRSPGGADNLFILQQLAELRAPPRRILATGRLATHLVGAIDLETVGQFFQRLEALAALTPTEHPLRRYEVLILDRLETFQQRSQETAELEKEALANGFEIVVDRYDLVVLARQG